MPNYSYRPEYIDEPGMDRMRFELGDTTFLPGELTAALCDEEYDVIIRTTPNWKKAKLACLKAILMKFSHQVNTSIDGVSYSFADRVKFWKELHDELEKKTNIAVPSVSAASMSSVDGGHYFHKDMMKNW